MLPKNLLGCSLPVAALEQLRHYSYRGGGSTPIDRFMNPWWEWVASKLPLWVSPNVLTLLGFFCTLLPMVAVTVYMPHMEEAAPRQLYYAIGLLLFIYQTLDAVDGKQARRTNTSTPLGQLFDHGCDAFSTIFVVFVNWAVLRMGLGFYAYSLLALVQMQLMVYTWWELHFNVYRCCTGGAGVTEGQLVTIGMVLLAGVLGPDVFLLKLSQIIPLSLQRTAAEMLPAWLLHQRIQMLVSFPFYVLLVYLLLSDVIDGWCRVPNRFTAMSQLIGCFAHVAFQFAFYCSDLLVSHPATSYALIVVNSSIVALRMSVAATFKLRLSPVHWPVLPFYIASIYFYCAAPRAGSPLALLVESPLSPKQLHQQQLAAPWLLAAVLLWSAVYLYNFITSTIGAICTFLNISCFYIDKQHHALPRERMKQPRQAKELQAVPASVTATAGIKRRGAVP